MKKYMAHLVAVALIALVFAGCTSQPPIPNLTMVPTNTVPPTSTIPTTVPNAAPNIQLEKCGESVFNTENQTCCNNVVYEGKNWQLAEKDMKCVNISSSDSAICSGRVYNPIKEGCCNGERIFSKKSQGCCGYVVYDLQVPGHNISCCGGTPYSGDFGYCARY